MTAMRLDDLKQYSDVLRTRNGEPMTVRFVEPRDAEVLQNYFPVALDPLPLQPLLRRRSANCRPALLDHFIHVGEADQFSVVATMMVDGFETIVGEARYAFDPEDASFEFGLSIDDRWQGHGIGKAILKTSNAAPRPSAPGGIFGDTLRSNESMIALARKSGYAFTNSPDDWKAGALRKAYRGRAAAEIPVQAGGSPPPPVNSRLPSRALIKLEARFWSFPNRALFLPSPARKVLHDVVLKLP